MATAKTSYIVAPNPNDGINGVVPVGSIVMWGTNYAPVGWLPCDGQGFLKTQYPALYDAIGDTFGVAPAGYFYVPNTLGVTIRGVSGSGAFSDVGNTGGADSVVVSSTQLPAHSHSITDPGHRHQFQQNIYNDNPGSGTGQYQGNGQDPGPPNGYTFVTGVPAGTMEYTNISSTDNNVTANDPVSLINSFLTLNYIIKAV